MFRTNLGNICVIFLVSTDDRFLFFVVDSFMSTLGEDEGKEEVCNVESLLGDDDKLPRYKDLQNKEVRTVLRLTQGRSDFLVKNTPAATFSQAQYDALVADLQYSEHVDAAPYRQGTCGSLSPSLILPWGKLGRMKGGSNRRRFLREGEKGGSNRRRLSREGEKGGSNRRRLSREGERRIESP